MTDRADPPAGLGTRGKELWMALAYVPDDSPAVALRLEACRTADRCEELDRIIRGKGVLDLMRFRLRSDWWDDEDERHVSVEVKFDSALAEARQQQGRLAATLEQIAKLTKPAAKSGGSAPKRPANVRDQLRERRERREQEA